MLALSRLAARRLIARPRRPASRAPFVRAMTGASNNEQVVQGMQPEKLFHFFAKLAEIPRPSKEEGQVLAWLKEFAQVRGLKTKQDDVGNLVIMRPGSGGGEAAPTVIIQGHVDMVCEKNKDTTHDFSKDPIRLVRKGDWLHAQGTTLGADNGIGVCTALALLDSPPTAKLPPLECLFTVDEETGLTGAFGISGDLLEGRTMLNLDSEDWGEVFIGCAGGGDSEISLVMPYEEISEELASSANMHTVNVGGLLGGHSGLMIAEGRGNALVFLVRALRCMQAAAPGMRVCSLSGGDKRNALPREAQASVILPQAESDAATAALERLVGELKAEYGLLEKDLFVRLDGPTAKAPLFPSTRVMMPDGLQRLCVLLALLPHGPLKFSHAVQGLVETSNNLACIQCSNEVESTGLTTIYRIITSTRSSHMSALEHVRQNIGDLGKMVGAKVEQSDAYPGWSPNPHSAVLEVTKQVYAEQDEKKAMPKVGAIHAGLECGILGAKFPGMDSVSFGPTIKGAHSPDECIDIRTVEPFWQLTKGVLERLAEKRA